MIRYLSYRENGTGTRLHNHYPMYCGYRRIFTILPPIPGTVMMGYFRLSFGQQAVSRGNVNQLQSLFLRSILQYPPGFSSPSAVTLRVSCSRWHSCERQNPGPLSLMNVMSSIKNTYGPQLTFSSFLKLIYRLILEVIMK